MRYNKLCEHLRSPRNRKDRLRAHTHTHTHSHTHTHPNKYVNEKILQTGNLQQVGEI